MKISREELYKQYINKIDDINKYSDYMTSFNSEDMCNNIYDIIIQSHKKNRNEMTKVFSQIMYKNGKEFIYECNITNDDKVFFAYGISLGKVNDESIISKDLSTLTIDFLSIRDILNNKTLSNYNITDYKSVTDEKEYYNIHSFITNEIILLPKSFLHDSYDVLKFMWDED